MPRRKVMAGMRCSGGGHEISRSGLYVRDTGKEKKRMR
jgi:hypothetical protein